LLAIYCYVDRIGSLAQTFGDEASNARIIFNK